MSRNTDSAVTSVSQLSQVRFRFLCEVWSASGGTAYACTGDKFIYTNATTYSPIGRLGGFDKIQEDSEPFPRAVTLWFAAINSAVIADVLSETLYSKPIKLYRCFLTDSFTAAGAAQLAFVGYVDKVTMKLGDSERGNYFEIACESRLRQPTAARYFNKETLWTAMGYSGDTFFNYQSQVPLFVAPWGNQPYGISADGAVSPEVTVPPAPSYDYWQYQY